MVLKIHLVVFGTNNVDNFVSSIRYKKKEIGPEKVSLQIHVLNEFLCEKC